MFIFDFVAETILDQILDWIYGKIIGFLNDFFVMMNNMGVELFELPWVNAVTTFFSYLGWALFGVGLVVGAFECAIEYQGGRGSIKDTAMNYIKGFMAVSLFTVVPVNLYSLCVSLQGTFGSAITGITNAESIGLTAQQVLMSASFPGIGNPILMTFCAVMMGYAVIKVFFANLKRGGILLIQIAVGTIQELVRQLRHAGAIAGENAGIHVHVNAAPYTARTLRNITNIMYCKEDLIYKALQVDVEREHRYCKKVEESFLQELNQKKPKSIEEVSNIWYRGRDGRNRHYHESRYHCLNLHSVFQKGTIEFRLFNSTTHAGKIKTYIQLCLAISAQALNQSSASRIKTTSTNEKYTFRTWLLRLGMIGDEFKTARKFLLENLEGGIAWKNPEQAERQKERLKAKKEKEESNQTAEAENLRLEEGAEEESQGMHMTM